MPANPVKCVRCHDRIPIGGFTAPATGTGDGVWDLKCYTFMTGLDADGNRVAERLSDESLNAELQRRAKGKAEAERLRKADAGDRAIQNIEALLLLVPEHSRTSCSDTNFSSNAYQARCTRCVLLEAERDGDWRNDMELEISVRYDPEHATTRKVN